MHFEEQLCQESLEEATLGFQVVGLEAAEPPLGLHKEFAPPHTKPRCEGAGEHTRHRETSNGNGYA